MCGIFGAVGREISPRAINSVLEVLHHRGPDGQGSFVDSADRVTLVHTRLAVIDLATGAQPLESEDGSLVLAANGEIYDFERIRSSLQSKGYRFRTKSDSEVILYLYQEYGLNCFEHLRGEFAFLLYDRTKKQFIAARDRFGIKPLYFSKLAQGFVFGSEMKAIFASALVTPKLNAAGFDPLIDRAPDEAEFPFENIEHLPPASYILVDVATGELAISRYWSEELPTQSAEPIVGNASEIAATCATSVLQELEEAVRLRLRADVPVGLYLSGGIDSSFIAALMKRNLDATPHSFSISFEGSARNEQEFARRAADFIGTEHHEITVTKQMLWNNLEQCLWFSELPFVSLAPVGKFLLSQEARKFVTVVLTGEGADEVFLGYRRFFADAIRDTRKRSSRNPTRSTQSRRLKLGLAGPMLARLSLLMFAKDRRPDVERARAKPSGHHDPEKPVINAVQEARLAAMPLDILCFLGDREEMAHSLEARLPFLDHKLFDMAKSIPADIKLRRGLEKAVLRDAAKGILPEDLRLRRKSGFMLTSEAVDFFGADRKASEKFQRHLARDAFSRVGVFNYRAFLFVRLLAKIPPYNRLLKQLRRNANKVVMYMLQVHMLHQMFIETPPWADTDGDCSVTKDATSPPEMAVA